MKLYYWAWNKIFSLDRLIMGLTKLVGRLEQLAANRRTEIAAIENQVRQLQVVADAKHEEAIRAQRIKDRFAALIQ
jgi:hypothetical protein